MQEHQALQDVGTWSIVDPKPGANIVGCKWVFRIKYKPEGTIDKHKARLVAKGFHQQPGIDFEEKISPVAKPATIRIVLSIAVQFGWHINQLDVSNAFLNGDLQEDVYMAQPPGFKDAKNPNGVYLLHKSIYEASP